MDSRESQDFDTEIKSTLSELETLSVKVDEKVAALKIEKTDSKNEGEVPSFEDTIRMLQKEKESIGKLQHEIRSNLLEPKNLKVQSLKNIKEEIQDVSGRLNALGLKFGETGGGSKHDHSAETSEGKRVISETKDEGFQEQVAISGTGSHEVEVVDEGLKELECGINTNIPNLAEELGLLSLMAEKTDESSISVFPESEGFQEQYAISGTGSHEIEEVNEESEDFQSSGMYINTPNFGEELGLLPIMSEETGESTRRVFPKSEIGERFLKKIDNYFVQSDPKGLEVVRKIRNKAGKTGAKISCMLMTFMISMTGKEGKFEYLKYGLENLPNYMNSIVLMKMVHVMEIGEGKMKSLKRKRELVDLLAMEGTELADEGIMEEILSKFSGAIVHLDTIFNSLDVPESMVLVSEMESKMESGLKQCEDELEEISFKVNEMKATFSSFVGDFLKENDMWKEVELTVAELWKDVQEFIVISSDE